MRAKSLKDLVHFDPEDVRREALFETEHLFSEVLCFDGKQHVGPMRDDEADALFTVVAGEGRFSVGRRSRTLKQWGVVLVPAGSEVTVGSDAGTKVASEPRLVPASLVATRRKW